MATGAYQLLAHLGQNTTICIGRLGIFDFPAGYYVYTGSAMAGLEQRVARHLSKRKRFHWHIDFLLEHCVIIRYAIKESSTRQECELAAETIAMDGAMVPVKGFGSSDCRCPAHLAHFETKPERLPAESDHGSHPNGRQPL